MIDGKCFKGITDAKFGHRAHRNAGQGNPFYWSRQPTNISGAFLGSRRMRLEAQQRTYSKDPASGEVWALDFDGVACDSCGESSLSAWKVGGFCCSFGSLDSNGFETMPNARARFDFDCLLYVN